MHRHTIKVMSPPTLPILSRQSEDQAPGVFTFSFVCFGCVLDSVSFASRAQGPSLSLHVPGCAD